MEFSPMARCRVTRLSAEETIPSTRFSARLERENTFLAPCSLTWSRLLLVSKQTHLCLKFKTPFSFFTQDCKFLDRFPHGSYINLAYTCTTVTSELDSDRTQRNNAEISVSSIVRNQSNAQINSNLFNLPLSSGSLFNRAKEAFKCTTFSAPIEDILFQFMYLSNRETLPLNNDYKINKVFLSETALNFSAQIFQYDGIREAN